MSGTKHDKGKPDLSLVPRPAMEAIARGLTYGAGKYGRYNYCGGFENTRLLAACLRHIYQYLDGQDRDAESTLSHLDHAIANLAMLLHCQELGTITENRRKT